MRKFLIATLLLLASSYLPSQAWPVHGKASGAATNGSAVMNVGDTQSANATNVFKFCGTSADPSHPEDIFTLNAAGYPSVKPATIMPLSCASGPGTFWPGTYKLVGPTNNLTPFYSVGGDISGCSTVNATVVSGCTGTGNTAFRPTASNWSISFTVGTGGFGALHFNSDASATYGGSGEVYLTRTGDEARYLSGKYWTTEYANGATKTGALCGASPGILRFMPVTMTSNAPASANWNNQTIFSYGNKVGDFAWKAAKYPAGARAGGTNSPITVTNSGTTSSAMTAAAAPDTPGSLTDGEVVIGLPNVTNTSTVVTLDVGSRGAKPVIYSNNSLPTIGGVAPIRTDVVGTFVYSGVLASWIYSPGGIDWILPVEATAQLANDCGADGWYNVPPMATSAYMTALANAVRDNVVGNGYFEYSNETWNFGFGIYGYGYNAGIKLGWTPDSGQNVDNWYALRAKQMSDAVVASYAATPSRGRPTMEYQGCCQSAGGPADNRFGGAQLVPNRVITATVTFAGGTPCVVTWANSNFSNDWPVSFTSTLTLPVSINSAQIYYVSGISGNTFNLANSPGGAAIACTGNGTGTITGNYTNTFYTIGNYSVKPNRPIDQTYSIGGAPYLLGENINGPDAVYTLTAANGPFFQCLTNAVEGASTAGCPASTAIGLVDWDLRIGRTGIQNVTCSGTTITAPAALGFSSTIFDNYVSFQTSGGTICNGLSASKLYNVTSTSTAGCPGAVICNFTVQEYINGSPSGGNVAVSNGTGTTTVGANKRQNLVYNASTYYAINQALAAKYHGDRPVSGAFTADLKGIQYEGDIEPQAGSNVSNSLSPTPASCTTMGVTSPAAPTLGITGSTTFGSSSLRLASSTGVYPGMVISGGVGDIPANTFIYTVNYDGTAAMSANATGSNAGQSLTLTGNCISDANKGIADWKQDNASYLTQILYSDVFLGKSASYPATFGLQIYMKTSASLSLMCAGPYTLIDGCLPTSSANQLWFGYRDWSRANP